MGHTTVLSRVRHLISSDNRAGSLRLFLCALATGTLLASSVSAQILEAVIMLPDTLGPLNGPYHLAWDDNPAHPRLYIGGEGDSGGVIVAEAITCERLARISTGPVKALCFVAPHGKLYVAKAGSDSIRVVDCATNHVVSTVRIASEAPALQYNHLNDRLYCSGSSVSVVDCAVDTVVHTIAVAASVFALDSTDNKLYVGSDGPLAVIDCATDSVATTCAQVDSAGALCYNPAAGKVYAASGDTLYAVGTQCDSIVARLHLGGLSPMLAYDPERDRLHCAYGGNLGSIDCAADTVVLTAYTGMVPYFLACNVARNLVYLGSYCAVVVLDGTTGQILRWITTQSSSGCGWSPSLDRLFCPPALHKDPPAQLCLFTTVDGSGDTLAGFFPLTLYASSVTVDTVHNRLYFAYPSLLSGCIGAVDCSRNIVTWYRYAAGAEAVSYNPNNDRLYWGVYDYDADTSVVVVYDCAAESIVKRIPVNGQVHAFRLHSALNKLYAETGGGLYTIDCKYDTILSCIPWPDMYPMVQFLVPEDNRYWYLGPAYVMEVDCLGDSVVSLVLDHLGSVEDACACPEDRKIYAGWSGRPTWIVDMDDPAHVDTLHEWIPNVGMRFFNVPNAHKAYWCANYPSGNGRMFIIDTRTDALTDSFWTGQRLSGMCLDHTGNYVYCTGYEDSLFFVVDTRADSVTAIVRLPTIPNGPSILNDLTDHLYVAQYGPNHGNGIPVIRDSMLIGLEELESAERPSCVSPTVVCRSAPLRSTAAAGLCDVSGREVAVLRAGLNDISRLAPGVYFVREELPATYHAPQAVRKVVVAR